MGHRVHNDLVINGTSGADELNGTTDDDVINGLGGDDIIHGDDGDDVISGGGGADTLYGDNGDDQLQGGSNDDRLVGGLGNDILTGGSGTGDTVVINADGANGIGSHNGAVLSVLTDDGLDQMTQVEYIEFNNGTVHIVDGNAQAFAGADTLSVDEQSGDDGNVLDNDFDIDDAITLTAIHSDNEGTNGSLGFDLNGEFGTLHLNADGSYTYTAFSGTDSLAVGESATDVFTYTINSGGVDTTQTLTITINGVNDDPTITSGADSATFTDTSGDDDFGAGHTGTLSASDVDTSDTLTYGITGGSADNSHVGYDVSLAGNYGTLYINSATGDYIYIPNDAAIEALTSSTSETFTFTVSDGHGGTDSQGFTVTVDGVNDTPDLAAIASATYTDTSGDDTFTNTTGTLDGSDRDSGQTLTYQATGASLDGSHSGFDYSIAGTYGTLYFNSSTGAYEYVPADGAIEGLKTGATDTFTFSVTDGSLTSGTQDLVINLNGVNDNPDAVATTPSATLVEAGGVNNGIAGTDTSTSTVSLSDRDSGDVPVFDTTALSNDGWTQDVGPNHQPVVLTWSKTGTYGTATLNLVTGVVTYVLNNDDANTQALNVGDHVTDAFTVFATDGDGGAGQTTITFNIDGSNDAAVISGTLSGSATEAGDGVVGGASGSAAYGSATSADVDNDSLFQTVTSGSTTNGYGTFAIDASGNWTFTVDDSNATVQAMNVGDSLSDSFYITSTDGTQQLVTVTIDGANDAAVVSGETSGDVTESGGTGHTGVNQIDGNLTDTDVDNLDNKFLAQSTTDTDNGYGTYSVSGNGHWSFHLDNNNLTVQALNDGDTLTETFTVYTLDGTPQIVSVVINGQNEYYTGTGADNFIRGSIYGDTMIGGDGNDNYVVNNSADKIVEYANQGNDSVKATVSYTLDANVENLTLSGNSDINGTGNDIDNQIVGNNGDNILSGGGGDDVLRGNNGTDVLSGGAGDDNLNGGVGNDTADYSGAAGGVTVSLAVSTYQNTGGDGWDKLVSIENLTGSAFNDTLTGNSGANILTGGLGTDSLTGGAGHDTFVFNTTADSAVGAGDTITDLTNADSIDLSAILEGTDLTFVSSFHDVAGEMIRSYDSGSGVTTFSLDVDGDGVADMQILATGDHHTYSNFITGIV